MLTIHWPSGMSLWPLLGSRPSTYIHNFYLVNISNVGILCSFICVWCRVLALWITMIWYEYQLSVHFLFFLYDIEYILFSSRCSCVAPDTRLCKWPKRDTKVWLGKGTGNCNIYWAEPVGKTGKKHYFTLCNLVSHHLVQFLLVCCTTFAAFSIGLLTLDICFVFIYGKRSKQWDYAYKWVLITSPL